METKMKYLILTWAALLTFLYPALSAERLEHYYTKDIKFIYYPEGEGRGLYYPGEKIRFRLILKNTSGKEAKLQVKTKITDADGKKVCDLPLLNFVVPAGKTVRPVFDGPTGVGNGYYILHTDIFSNGKKAVFTQCAFAVVSPIEGKRDPFFGVDKSAVFSHMLEGYRRLGAGALGAFINRHYGMENPKEDIPRRLNGNRWKAFLASDFILVGGISPEIHFKKEALERVKKGLPALGEKEITHYTDWVRAFVSGTKARINLWLIQREYDAGYRYPGAHGSSTAVLSNYVLMARIAYREIKKINPKANVAVLGAMGIDYFNTDPMFKLSKMILDDLGKEYDLICIDGYNGNWNGTVAPLALPENGFRSYLMDAADLSASYGRPRLVINAETGYWYDFFAPYDSAIARQVAQYTARRLIINRSTPCPFSSWHLIAAYYAQNDINSGKADPSKPVKDGAIAWRTVNGEKKYAWVEIPKMAGVAYATVARILAFVKPYREIRIGTNIYCYTFMNAAGKSIAALWSIDDPVELKVNLPSAGTQTDMLGRFGPIAQGANVLHLSQSPIYITLNDEVEKLAAAITVARPVVTVPVIGEGRRISEDATGVFLRNCENMPKKVKLESEGKSTSLELKPCETRMVRIHSGTAEKIQLFLEDGRQFDVPVTGKAFAVKRISRPEFNGSGKWFAQASRGRLITPDHVFPKKVLIPEWGLFKLDGNDISADYAFGYDDQNLYFGVKVKDKIHMQRYAGEQIWRDDAVQFAFTTRNGIPEALRAKTDCSNLIGKTDCNIGMALGGKGPEIYSFAGSRISGKKLHWLSNITRSGSCTVYEIAIPLAQLGIKPEKGNGLRFGFVVMDNNRAADKSAQYHLAFSHGVSGGQDVSKFNTLIFK